MGKKPTAWELFFECFKEGEEVVIVDDDERFWFGKLKLHEGLRREKFFSLVDFRGTEKIFEWIEVFFMGHDGFPVRKLIGADGSRTIEAMDTKDITAAVRNLATKALCDICSELKNKSVMSKSRRRRDVHGQHRYVDFCLECGTEARKSGRKNLYKFLFGDPFFIENVSAELHNPGNSAPEFWGCHDYEEVLILTAIDGAKAQLFDVSNIYYFGD